MVKVVYQGIYEKGKVGSNVFEKGVPTIVTHEEWEDLKNNSDFKRLDKEVIKMTNDTELEEPDEVEEPIEEEEMQEVANEEEEEQPEEESVDDTEEESEEIKEE